eukprot:g8645.t1
MSGSQSSSEDDSSVGESSDEASEDESVSVSGSGSETGSSSGSGSGDGSNSDSDSDSSSGSGSGSSGSSSGEEDEDNGSDSEASGGSEEEEEEERDTEEKRQARKREDFDKMKEISAHMDNIVQRLSAFFPRDGKESDPPVAPELPVLPLSPPDTAVDRSGPARIAMMDRAVSARKITTDRAVSAASGMHFEDDLSASTVSDTPREVPRNTGRRKAPGNGAGVATRTKSPTGADRTGRDRTGPECRVGSRDRYQASEPLAAQGRRESWQGNERNANSNVDTGLAPNVEPGGVRRRSRVSLRSPPAEIGVESLHERLLWDDLRESLEGAAGGERVPARSTWARGVTVEKTKEARDREQRRRRLIDEAIAVLLEGSSSDSSGGSGSSSDG